ncbi:SDR family NAD(P)-dependent oxidoreductase [Streptomyces sp. NPDC048362]|uniref:SDR family NAD(P)-dependent oxidoreductase n=1 Tax=Streptomyces sp. NPDC048362 TaxID=3365539 RepID=UPI0037189574
MPENDPPKQGSYPLTTADGVRSWLASAVAEAAGIDQAAVAHDRPLSEFGLGSRQLIALAAGLTNHTGVSVEPALLFQHPTIDALTLALFPLSARCEPSAAPAVHSTASTDEVAIVSMACRYPGGAEGPEALWQVLDAGTDAIREVPPGRWQTSGLYDPDPGAKGKTYSLRGGFLDGGIDRFDAAFFGISPREAAAMDPQQRILLQTAWEAFERAGVLPETLNGSRTGVYLGLYGSGYLASASLDQLDGHVGTGSAGSVASGRIAYSFGLRGPAVTIDTACSSSLVALHLAARALVGGECDLALAGGATLLVTPRSHVEFSRLRGLSPSGQCRPFSASADGVVWAEGCGLILLKRLDDARRDGDRILAVIKGSAVNQDGRSQGLSAPNGGAQERLLRAALEVAGLTAHDVDYVEAHGTGTPLGDPIELRALANVFGPGRSADRPLSIGSLKSNIGHTQAAAGVGGVIKTVLALVHERVPASLHADDPTGHIDWSTSGLQVRTEAEVWPRDAGRVRRAGVSAFGISGTNAHIILEEAPGTPVRSAPSGDDRPTLFPLSGRSGPSLQGQAARLRDALEANPDLPLSAVASTLAHHRTHFGHRSVVRAIDRPGLLAALGDLAEDQPDPAQTTGPHEAAAAGKVAFVFPGQGAQWAGMARDLLARDTVFAAELDRCDAALHRYIDWSVAAVLRGDEGSPSPDRVDVVQPVLFAVMVSLAAVWRARGVEPDAVIGHSQGEVAAAYVAGVLSLDDAAAVVAVRSRAVVGLAGSGTMAVIALPHTEVAALLEGGVSIAAVNSSKATVVAGTNESVESLLAQLEARQTFVRRLEVDYPSHSAQVEPVRAEIVGGLDGIVTSSADSADIAWYSTVTCSPVTREVTGEYWYTNLRETVCFAATAERMLADGYRHFVELSPHPSLLTALRTIGEDTDYDLIAIGSLRRDEDGPDCLTAALAEFHARGGRIDWHLLIVDSGTVDLPTYAWEEQPYWVEPASVASLPALFHRAAHPLLGVQLQSADETAWTFRGEWSLDTADWLVDHRIFRRTVMSGTTLMELCRAALAVVSSDAPLDVTDLLILSPLVLPESGTVEVSVEVRTASSMPELTVHSRLSNRQDAHWTLHATASATESTLLADVPPVWPDNAQELWTPDTYERLTDIGLDYGPAFQGVVSVVSTGEGELLARLSLPSSMASDVYPLHPALLDAALQATAAFNAADGRVLLPVAVGRFTTADYQAGDVTAWLRKTSDSASDLTLDVTLWDGDGLLVGRLVDVRLRAVHPADLDGGVVCAQHMYEVAWTPIAPLGGEAPAIAWAVTGDRADPQIADALKRLESRETGVDVFVRFWPRTENAEPAGTAHELVSEALGELQALITRAAEGVSTRTVWVTRGAISAAEEDLVGGYAQSVLWGLVRSAREEHPDLGLTLLDLDDSDPVFALTAAYYSRDEPELAVRDGEVFAPRLVRARGGDTVHVSPPGAAYKVIGLPDRPHLIPVASSRLASGQVRIQVEALALSAPGTHLACAGVVSEIASDVVDVVSGQRVLAVAESDPSSQAVVAAADVAPLPDTLSCATAVAELAGPEAHARTHIFPVSATRAALRRAAATDRPVVLDLIGGPTWVPTDGTVLITGGLGAVGRHIATVLAENGVQRIVLTARQGPMDARAADAVAELRALGTEAAVVACDVTDPVSVADALACVDGEYPLRGVVHCAGVLDDGVITELTPERLARVLRPKVDGAVHLHRLTANTQLDLFLLISSAAGVVGSAGQGNYAAANAFLDQLAHHRHALGLAGTSISFGAWAGEGLAARADLNRMARRGYRALTPDEGRDLVAMALRRDTPHLVPWALDLQQLRTSNAAGSALWRLLVPMSDSAKHADSLADRLGRLPAAQRAERLTALVREEVCRALGLRSSAHLRLDQPLRDLGMDSVTAVELRNHISARLGVKLPATLLFDYPTVARLSSHLLVTVLSRTPETSADVIRSTPTDASPSQEPIAIVAMACRLPGGVSEPNDLWRLVAEGSDAIGPFPERRWDVESLYDPDPDAPGKSYTCEGGFLDDIESFDPSFFGITPREAAAMDPQQRLLLEISWEALERAGIVPAQLRGSSTGVYVGMFGSGYLAGPALDQLDGYVGTGSALSVASGRLAYTLGLHGPALTVDTACSSSLVATHLAAQALRAGECDLALAGGVTLMVTAQTFVEFSRLRGLSPTGRCRSFSDDADGAVWAEGAGMLVLKRLSDAQRDGDEVLAVLRGTAVNQDGHSQGLSAPNGPAQEQVIRRALKQSGITSSEIDYVEAHGTGTTLGDPIEAGALVRVFGDSRPHGWPLHIGSLKSNIGHTQAASGVCGLIKVVLSLRNQTLPRTLHAGSPSRHIDWESSGLRLLQEPVAWPVAEERTRRAGVSAFGISGTNAHVIVEEAPRSTAADGGGLVPVGRQLLVLSARSEAALRAQAGRLARHAIDDGSLSDLAYSLARHRSHFEWRTAVVAGNREELLSSLEALSSGRTPLNKPREEQTGKVAFVFSGHGGQWPGMERGVLSRSESFRAEMNRIDQAVRRQVGWSVLDALSTPDGSSWLSRTEHLQPVLFALNASLAAAWRELGVVADGVVGHSLGEIAAAYSAGALTLDEAVAIVTSRAEVVAPLVGCGGMLALHLPLEDVKEMLTVYADRLFIGAVNSSGDTAVSGETGALAEFRAQLTERGVTTRVLSTPFASHTPFMEPLRAPLRDRLSDVRGSSTSTAVYSSLRAETIPGEDLDADYWFANLRQPVRFGDTIRRMLDDGYRYFVELSPHPSLLSSIEAVAADAGTDAVGIGSLRRGQTCPDLLLERVGELYTAGHTPAWPALFPQSRRLDLPTYPFARERHWLAPVHTAGLASSPLLGTHVQPSDDPGRDIFESEINLSFHQFDYLTDHQVDGQVWLPGAAFLDMALEAAAKVFGDGPAELADVRFLQPLHLDANRPVRLQLVLKAAEGGSRDFTIASADVGERSPIWQQHVTGRVAVTPETIAVHEAGLLEFREQCSERVDLTALYAAFAGLGLAYGPAFRGLEEGHRSANSAVVRLSVRPSAGHLLHPATLDSAFHSAAMPTQAPEGRAFVPAEVARVRHTGLRTAPTWASCDLLSVDGDSATLDLRLWDESGRIVLEARGLRLAALSPLDGALFETHWRPRPLAHEPAREGSWLILADETGMAQELSDRLDGLAPYVLVRRGETYAADGPNRYVLDTADAAQLRRLLDEAFADALPAQVVQLSALDAPAIVDAHTLEAATHLSCSTTTQLVRAITSRARGRAPRLFVVIRGSQAAGDSSTVVHPQQALAWGFGLSIAQEHPELALTLVDLPAAGGADMLWTQLWHADDERLIALRDVGRLVPRLARTRPDANSDTDRADGVHLITGGLGGVGRVIAERFVRRGCRRLVLMGRSTPGESAKAWISALEQRGVTVHISRTDVTDRAGLSAALEAIRREMGPVTRIVHAAGVLDDATLANLSEEKIRRVLAPKVLGTVLLTELIPEADDLVLFASVAGLMGSAGQSAYSAANAFLDAWAHHLVHAGRRALSLDWGAWAGAGMAAESDRATQTNRSGLATLSPHDGSELFERVLTTSRRQLAPVAFDWNRLSLDMDAHSRPLLAELLVSQAKNEVIDGTVRRVFAATGERDRAEALERYVRTRVAAVSGTPVDVSVTTALRDLGLDSLMLVRLRNSFARDLGSNLAVADIFAAKDIRDLARLLAVSLPADASQDRGIAVVAARSVPPTELHPATRDVIRLLRSAQPGVPGAVHSIGLAVRLATPTTPESLGGILDRIAARHAALRTVVVPGPEGGRELRVDREPAMPLLLWTEVEGPDATERLRLLLERPYSLAEGPLWRFELIDGGPDGQFLVFGAHHAVSDLQSLLLVAAEIDAELSGTVLDSTPTNRDIDLLVRAQQSGDEGLGDDWRAAFRGSQRLDLTLARPRPDKRSYRSDSITVVIPNGLMERISATAGSLGITPAAFCLGTLTVLLSRKQEREQFVLAVPVDTRIHADADGAVGFFGVPVPFPAMAKASESVAEVLRRTDSRLRKILSRGVMFTDVLSTLAREGLHRPNAPLVEVYFNYVRFASRLANLEVLPAGAGHSDLDLMITMTPDTGTIRLDHTTDVLDADTVTALGEEFLRLLDQTAGNAMEPVREAPVGTRLARPVAGPRLAVAATFALGDLPAMCEAALETEQAVVSEAPYHQVLAALRNPSGVLADPATTLSVVLLRAADLERFGPVDDAMLAELSTTYPAALKQYATRTPLIVGILPTDGYSERLLKWERTLVADLAGAPGIAVLGPDRWVSDHTGVHCFDKVTDKLAHLPFTPAFQAAIAIRLADVVRAVRRPAPKAIAVDGDETLWGGVAGEVGPDAVDLTGPRALLASRLLQWREAGTLLVLLSNNDEATVRAVLDRPDSPLSVGDFSVLSASWAPKPVRLAQAARTLNIGLDSFLFLDDNPAEIAKMRAQHPLVLSVTCPPDIELAPFLQRLWPLVPAAATIEDSLRSQFYEQEREREIARTDTSFETFLADLELHVEIRSLSQAHMQRSEQLIRRTNQFVMRMRSDDDLVQWLEQGEVWTATARDRFGDYGQIALLALRTDGGLLDVSAWTMSCRALGRGIEERLLSWLADRAEELGCAQVRFTAERTPRNAPARRLVAALGGGNPDDEWLDVRVIPEDLRTFRSWEQR